MHMIRALGFSLDFHSSIFLHDFSTTIALQAADVFAIEWKIRAAKPRHLRNGILAAGPFDQHAVSGDHRARAIDSVYAVDIHWFPRVANDCQELSDVSV